MAYVSGFEHDVFVSYAHVDNQLSDGSTAQRGWVTRLKANLNRGVGVLQKDIFIDHQLQPGHPFGDVLRRKVKGSALLLILLSQNYIDSEWCGKELEHFIVTHGEDPTRPRDVFVVELTPFGEFIDVPENIANLRKELLLAKFWYQTEDVPVPRVAGDPSPEESKDNGFYWLQRDVLRHALDTRLRELKRGPVKNVTHEAVLPVDWGSASSPFSARSSPNGTPAVLLAEVTRDLMVK
ncbi:MAG: toll/interleukin-1 receptor domain-containing protein, partial [Gammaproteobacteria bacterium]